MKNIIITSFFLLSVIIPIYSQWQPDFQINNDTGISYTSFNNGKSIAVNGDTIIVIWQDKRIGYWGILYRRSFNNGQTWSPLDNIAESALNDFTNPSIIFHQGIFYIVFIQEINGLGKAVYLKKSSDGGVGWTSKQIQAYDNNQKENPSVAAYNNIIHISWGMSGNIINYKRSTNEGETFTNGYTWQSISADYGYPSIAAFGSNVLIAFQKTLSGNTDIICVHSSNDGVSWNDFQQLSDDPAFQGYPTADIIGPYAFIAWEDARNSHRDIYCRRSTTSGISWMGDVRLTSHSSNQTKPSLCTTGEIVNIVWEDDRDSNEIYYLRGINHGGSWQSVTRLTNNAASSIRPSINYEGPKLHMVWSDKRSGNNYNIFYKNNPTGNAIGIKKISSDLPVTYTLGQNYPNPFNPSTQIEFSIPRNSDVKLIVYDVMGRELSTLVNEKLNAGIYKVNFDAANLSSGVYFYKLLTEEFNASGKMLLIK